MRPPRNFTANRCYHLVSRIAHRAFFLTEDERTRFVDRLWRVARFSGIDVLSYCFMSNHFHILIYVPEPFEHSDSDLLNRIKALYTGIRIEAIQKEWTELAAANDSMRRQAFRQKFLKRMWNVSEFMKTLKQNATMSYNSRLVHSGTMWEARFRAKAYGPDEKVALMNVAGYIDRNPVKAKVASWPDLYAWCGFAAACKGDTRCIDGYRFIYSFAPLSWEHIREMHEKTIRLAIQSLEDEDCGGKAKTGLSVDEEKREKTFRRTYEDAELAIPHLVPHLIERGRDKVAFDLLGLLADGAQRPAELRTALGIRSAHYFTTQYLTPLLKAGFIKTEGEGMRFSPTKSFHLTQKGFEAIRQPYHSNPTTGV